MKEYCYYVRTFHFNHDLSFSPFCRGLKPSTVTAECWHSTSLWFWPLFWPLGLLASMFGLFPSLYFGLFCKYKGQNTNRKRDQTLRPKDQEAKKERPKDQEAKKERPKDQEAKRPRGQNKRPK